MDCNKQRSYGWRGWLLRLALCIIVPAMCFGILEAGLRLGGYGYPTGFFLGPDAKGVYTTNKRFGWSFFPRSIARVPHLCTLSDKPSGTIRIFILGSSAAMGTPEPAYSFGRILSVMLRERYPGIRFEVVNVAMTAINSHVVLEIARDCAARQPDLFIVYTGNNEVIGPYGPGTVFHAWTPWLSLIRSSIWLKSMRISQLCGAVVDFFRDDHGTMDRWHGMEMFTNNMVTAEDPRLVSVYENYRRNLADICNLARRAGAGVVLSTVVVNLRDCPPLASRHRLQLRTVDLNEWEALYKAGVELETNGRWLEAIDRYNAAAGIDDRFAELMFRIGRCLMKTDRSIEAKKYFELARDLDVLRFRADSRINAIVREVAGEQKDTGVRLVDAEQKLAQGDQDSPGVPGRTLFYEHVHLTFDGDYLLARAVLDKVSESLPQLAAFKKSGDIPSRQRCAELLALTPWDEYQMADYMVDMTAQKIFSNQLDHDIRQAEAIQKRDSLRKLASAPQTIKSAWQTYEAALARTPDDWILHARFGGLAVQFGRPDVAIKHLRIAIQAMPGDARSHNDLGIALAGRGQVDDAIVQYQEALKINPDLALAHNNLAISLNGCKRVDEAITHFRRALEIKPRFALAHYNLAIALAGRGQVDEAIKYCEKALEIEPELVEARRNLNILRTKR